MTSCPTFKTTSILGKKWTYVILQELCLNKGSGFNFLISKISKISPKILSKRLRDMENEGLVVRTTSKESNVAKKYSLTEKGLELKDVIDNIKKWSIKYSGEKYSGCRDLEECVKCPLFK